MISLPVDSAAAWLHAEGVGRGRRVLVALAGVPGAGKSTVAAKIATAFNATTQPGAGTMAALGMDGFHLPKAALRRMPEPDVALARRGAPWTFDPSAMAERLAALRDAEGPVTWPGFAHDVGDPVEAAHTVPPDVRVVLIEGLYVLLDDGPWREVSACFDLRWFLEVPRELARERLIRRHMAAWKIDRMTATQRAESNDALNAEIVLASRARAEALLVE
jgi:pantothenate kinase